MVLLIPPVSIPLHPEGTKCRGHSGDRYKAQEKILSEPSPLWCSLTYKHLAGCVIFGKSIAMLLPSNFDLTVPFTLTLLR